RVVGAGGEDRVGPGGEVGDRGPEGEAVARLAARLAPELLGRGVAGRAGRAGRHIPGGPGVLEVDHDDGAVVGYQDVVGVEVADDDAGGVEGGQGLGQGGGPPALLAGRERGGRAAARGLGGVRRNGSARYDLPPRRRVGVLLGQEDV